MNCNAIIFVPCYISIGNLIYKLLFSIYRFIRRSTNLCKRSFLSVNNAKYFGSYNTVSCNIHMIVICKLFQPLLGSFHIRSERTQVVAMETTSSEYHL